VETSSVTVSRSGNEVAGSLTLVDASTNAAWDGRVLLWTPDDPGAYLAADYDAVLDLALLDVAGDPIRGPPGVLEFFHHGQGDIVWSKPSEVPLLGGSQVGNDRFLHGRPHIASLGLYDHRARFYEPGTQLFLEPDPLGPVDSPNLYQAFGFDGMNVVDPWGTYEISDEEWTRFNSAYPNATYEQKKAWIDWKFEYKKYVDSQPNRAQRLWKRVTDPFKWVADAWVQGSGEVGRDLAESTIEEAPPVDSEWHQMAVEQGQGGTRAEDPSVWRNEIRTTFGDIGERAFETAAIEGPLQLAGGSALTMSFRRVRRLKQSLRRADDVVGVRPSARWSSTNTPWQRRVFQRPDAEVDWDFVRPAGTRHLPGVSNRTAARRGYAPVRVNPSTGRVDELVLHHANQNPRGSIIETWRSNHGRIPHGMEVYWRKWRPDWAAAWQREQSAYWRWRTGRYNPSPTDRLRLPGD
jgi:RHS repeat-associated protein